MGAMPDLPSSVLACLVALVAVLKHAHGTAPRRDGALVRVPLLPVGPPTTRLLLLAAFALAGAVLRPTHPALGLALLAACVLLALDARLERGALTGAGWRPLRALDRVRARRQALREWFGGRGWLDATTPCGATLLGAIYACAWLARGTAGDALGDGAVLITPLFLTATRLHRPDTLHVTLARLSRVHEAMTAETPDAGDIVVLDSARGHARDARWRVSWTHSLAGLEHVDLVIVDARWLDRTRPMTAWLACAVEDSPADHALASAFPRARRHHQDDRVAYLAFSLAPHNELAHLRAWLTPAAMRHAA